MEMADLHKVWEIKALKRPRGDEARRILENVAKQVQPIMRRRKWRVKVLSEFCPANSSLLGLNVGRGVHVKLRLRRPRGDLDFFSYEEVLDTMLHELCHIEHGPHNALFYKLWDDIRKECEELITKGIIVTGQGFDVPGRRLGGVSRQPPLSSLGKTALVAAEKRKLIASLLPSGPKRLGGDSSIMASLTPVQAAAMAAERRILDDLWCASESCVHSSVVDVSDDDPLALACDACGSERPKDTGGISKTWSCRFCTLDNNMKLEKCSACGEWRYSRGAPTSLEHRILVLDCCNDQGTQFLRKECLNTCMNIIF
ncbi:unnamed protein product [Spirodela intermedia]|uniref:Uncharacterized protein n=1 Tax=Spirodela intermedia TaxID=51605 RepID=A0A7I8J7V9_SPIIN|nr:unnamed protein product [Spirodela intermedia]CAA6666169.1 unnamed protein product [Spirodela intermedia]